MAVNITEGQRVQEAIREEILNGAFTHGSRLPQRQLAERYQTTTIVVRDALRALETEGIVEIEAKWGATVAEITPERLRERYIVREALECMAARLASQEISRRELGELEELAIKVDAAHRDSGVSRQNKAQIHHTLHERIVEASHCGELVALVRRSNLHTIILSNAFHIDWNAEESGWHAKLVAAIASGDEELAEREMRVHVHRGLEMETAAIATEVDTPAPNRM